MASDSAQGRERPAMLKRRSDRVSIRIPVSIIGTDLSGRDFAESAFTHKVARYGASIVTKAALGPEQVITLARADGVEIQARIIGQISIGAEGNVYGIAFSDPKVDFWGIHFPPVDADSLAKVLLECAACGHREIVPLQDVEFEVFQANDRLQRMCAGCRDTTLWRQAQYEAGPERVHRFPEVAAKQDDSPASANSAAAVLAEAVVPTPPANRRRFPRVKVHLMACISYGQAEDIVRVINVSRGGILVSSARQYPIDAWIQVAVPYTEGAANILVPARIVRCVKVAPRFEYGIKYVKS